MKLFIILTNGDDWEGLYCENKLIAEGHNIPRDILIKSLSQGYDSFQKITNFKIIEQNGCCPPTLEDLNISECEEVIEL